MVHAAAAQAEGFALFGGRARWLITKNVLDGLGLAENEAIIDSCMWGRLRAHWKSRPFVGCGGLLQFLGLMLFLPPSRWGRSLLKSLCR